MGISNWLGFGKDIAEPINAVGNLYTTDKARIEAQTNYESVVQKPVLAQLDNNKASILSGRWFDSGWIALIGWTSGFLVLLFYAPQIVITDVVWGAKCIETGIVSPFPMKPDDLLNLVYLLFGFGGMSLVKKKLG